MKLAFFFLTLSTVFLLFTRPLLASPTASLSIQTDKSSYQVGEVTKVYGKLTSNDVPVPNHLVSLEVQDPKSNSIITRIIETNASGDYLLAFRLSAESLLGIYSVHVTCNYGEAVVLNTTLFLFMSAAAFTVTVNTNGTSVMIGDGIRIMGTVALNGVPVKQVQVAIEILDPENNPISVRVLQTDISGIFNLDLKISEDSKLGNYTIHASASHEGMNALATKRFEVKPRSVDHSVADINGDGKVNIVDITLVARAWGSHPGDPRWDSRCDLDKNGLINIIDITLVAREYRS